ncbi:hypothetical protein [Nakamurella aerolata]|uniref:Uncharacterized protein n=1 Tax=Nakamurella aerolata TaxID=1656892 RepID=A0A849ACN3_9ACTN|nr:hypothetical protein [Nakamurella aerolata]NNG36941.1 hypothetical protein [Nakamurella aerolata]
MLTPDDIAGELGMPPPAEGSTTWNQWERWISDAMLLIRLAAEARGLSVALLDPEVVDYVVRRLVAGQARQPRDGALQVSVSVDDASSARTYSAPDRVTVLPDDLLDMLFPGSERASFSIRPGYQPGCPTAPAAPYRRWH